MNKRLELIKIQNDIEGIRARYIIY